MRLFALLLALWVTPLAAQSDGAADAVVAAMDSRDWDVAYDRAASLGPAATALVTWTRLRAGAGTFADYVGFLATHPDWPGLDRLHHEGELAIGPDHDPLAVVAYFGGDLPQTGHGAVYLARALRALNREQEAEDRLIEVWLNRTLTDQDHILMLIEADDLLAPHHSARTDAMLWRWQTEDAARTLPLLDADQAALAAARIALIDGAQNAPQLVGLVPEALRADPGLAYDRFNRLAVSGDYTDAAQLLRERSNSAEALGQPFRWASWRATLARWTMREGRPQAAYDMATQHHLQPTGRDAEFYADLEWVAGYLALRYLDDPALALTHFERVEAAVSGPISLSRASYWQARALEALGDTQAAQEQYLAAAQHQTAFYGLLASDRLGLSLDPLLAGTAALPSPEGAAFAQSDQGQAMSLLLDAGDLGQAVIFVAHLARTLPQDELTRLGAYLTEREEWFLVVLVGKAAVARDILIPQLYYPLHPLAEADLPVATELALSIARRESEFNAAAGSPVGALGLMQLMPGTAQDVARDLGLPYSRARLTSDWPYNATLGSQYLADLIERFGPSPVLVAAGYNAGPGRPSTWMTQRGDPRRGEVDVIDWIEHIPFTETRNYVMRVTESMPIYQARLTGQVGPVRFMDLLIGAPPMIRPQARPTDAGVPPGRPEARP